MVTENEITPYIKSKVLVEMNDSDNSDISDNDIEVKKPIKVKKPKSKSIKSKAGRVLSTINKGVKVTANYMGECSERYHEYNAEQQTKTVKSKPKKKSVSKPKKKSVAKPKTKPKTTKRKTTAKTVKKTVRRSVKATRNTQRDFEDETMRCM